MDWVKTIEGRVDAISAVFWFALSGAVCYGASLLGLGSVSEPGSGFILFWSGVILALLSLVVFARSALTGGDKAHDFGAIRWPKVFFVLAVLVLYGLSLERLGFVLATFLLLSFLLSLSDEARWPAVLVAASGGALGSFALFDLWLHIRLPRGFLGF